MQDFERSEIHIEITKFEKSNEVGVMLCIDGKVVDPLLVEREMIFNVMELIALAGEQYESIYDADGVVNDELDKLKLK